jgi:hypothetical protein
VHVTVPEEAEQVQPPPDAETKFAPPGRLSTTTTSLAADGPALRTEIV